MAWVLLANGVSTGMLLFLLASGMSLIFGVMQLVNLAHGSFYLLAGYLGIAVARQTGSFGLGVGCAVGVVAVLSLVIHRGLLRQVGGEVLGQVLLTMGLLLVFADVALMVWGGYPQVLPTPAALGGAVRLGPVVVPRYRLFVMVVGAAAAAGLWWGLERTRAGAVIRAVVDDREMAEALGVRVPAVAGGVFGLGAALAALGGVLGAPILGVYPGMDLDVTTMALAVVITGGLGSLPGTLLGSLLIGVLDSFGKVLLPELGYVTFFAPMVLVLALRPTGLLGGPWGAGGGVAGPDAGAAAGGTPS